MAEKISIQSMREALGEHYSKCPRCWQRHGCHENFGHTESDIANAVPEKNETVEERQEQLREEHLCDECQELILDSFPGHPSAPHIRAALALQKEKYRQRTS